MSSKKFIVEINKFDCQSQQEKELKLFSHRPSAQSIHVTESVEINRTTSAPKSILRYDVDQDKPRSGISPCLLSQIKRLVVKGELNSYDIEVPDIKVREKTDVEVPDRIHTVGI